MNPNLNFTGADVDPDFVDQASHSNPYSEETHTSGVPMQGDNTGRSYTGADQPMDTTSAADAYGSQGLIDEQNVGEPTGGAFGTTMGTTSAADAYGSQGLIDEQNVGEPTGGAFGTTRSGHPTSGIDSDYYKSDSQAQTAASNQRQSLGDKIKEGYERLTGQTTSGEVSSMPYDDHLS